MAHKKNTTNLKELLLQCVTQPDPMLSMLEWLCTDVRSGCRSGVSVYPFFMNG